MDIRPVDDRVSVAPQIRPADLAAIAEAGYRAVINNRPDGEEDGQPAGEAIRAAAAATGLAYHAIPVGTAGIGAGELEAMDAALAEADGPVLAFCRSGTRSCHLWALATAREGQDPATIVGRAAAAGYDLSPLRTALERLSAR